MYRWLLTAIGFDFLFTKGSVFGAVLNGESCRALIVVAVLIAKAHDIKRSVITRAMRRPNTFAKIG